ncbi:MAG: NAD(P)H-dependent oxidoreductase [Pararhizobium sp.]
MPRRILIINGHPENNPSRLCWALAQAYADGARSAGHYVRRIDLATIDIPLLRSQADFETGKIPDLLQPTATSVEWAEHLVFVFPLWLGTMPAVLKAFLEQIMRPGTAFSYPTDKREAVTKSLLAGRSARLIVTMGMPVILYRVWFLSHGVAVLRRNILNFIGIRPVHQTLFGTVHSAKTRQTALIGKVRKLGERAS